MSVSSSSDGKDSRDGGMAVALHLPNASPSSTSLPLPSTTTSSSLAPKDKELAAASPTTTANIAAAAAVLAATAEARKRREEAATKFTSMEDVRRMRFLALLCGKGAAISSSFQNPNSASAIAPVPVPAEACEGDKRKSHHHHRRPLSLLLRERSGSVGGMGTFLDPPLKDASNAAAATAMDCSGKGHGRTVDSTNANISGDDVVMTVGKGGVATNITGKQIISSTSKKSSTHHPFSSRTRNYQPTTPANLSRRILHKCGVGYLDESLPLLLSALSDHFLASILVPAMACRDRRLEGYRAVLKERHKRFHHRRRVLKERHSRNKRLEEEIQKRKKLAQEAIREAKDVKLMTSSKGNSNSSSGGGGAGVVHSKKGMEPLLFQLSENDVQAVNEYKKHSMDLDAEEDYYYDSYKGDEISTKGGDDGDDNDGKLDNRNVDEGFEEEEDDEEEDCAELDDDELDSMLEEEEDITWYDLKLRDLARPLNAWGFDITSKLGVIYDCTDAFLGANDAHCENKDEEEEEDDDDNDGDGSIGGDDESDDNMDEVIHSDDDDDVTTGDEGGRGGGGGGGGGGGSTKRKHRETSASVSPPKKKVKTTMKAGVGGSTSETKKKNVTRNGGGAAAAASTTAKKNTTKVTA